jgi:hypothetical protein
MSACSGGSDFSKQNANLLPTLRGPIPCRAGALLTNIYPVHLSTAKALNIRALPGKYHDAGVEGQRGARELRSLGQLVAPVFPELTGPILQRGGAYAL